MFSHNYFIRIDSQTRLRDWVLGKFQKNIIHSFSRVLIHLNFERVRPIQYNPKVYVYGVWPKFLFGKHHLV